MKHNRIFVQARWRLASWYAGIISIILLIFALGVYETVVHAHHITINQELESVAGTLHDSLLPILKESGKLEPEINALLPDVCFVETNCYYGDNLQSYRLGVIQQGKYYLRLFDLSEQLLAVTGIQVELPHISPQNSWETLTDSDGIRYRQISLLLHTQNGENWGYLQVGRSLQDFDNYVTNVKWILILGVPIVVLSVMAASWYLAGLAIGPIYQSYRQIQQFTADAAHELRTPLAAIQATVQANLMSSILPESQARDTLTTILRQNKRLSFLVADLLTLCRIDGELTNQTIKRHNIFLADLITEIVEELAALAMASEIELTSHINISKPLQVIGDRPQLSRLIINLITNAIQYTLPGGKVILTLQEDYHHAIISIRDTGIGISKNEQQHIFDRFYRVDKARSKSKHGFGLGLSIANAIALAHRGSIEVQSAEGKGSNFIIKLPKSK